MVGNMISRKITTSDISEEYLRRLLKKDRVYHRYVEDDPGVFIYGSLVLITDIQGDVISFQEIYEEDTEFTVDIRGIDWLAIAEYWTPATEEEWLESVLESKCAVEFDTKDNK